MIELTKQEDMLYKTAKHQIMTELEKRVDAVLKEGIVRLRGVNSEQEREKIKQEVVEEMQQTTKKILEL